MIQAGIYIHVPFCKRKCPYCDFYSMAADDKTKQQYVDTLLYAMEHTAEQCRADTLYFGGGTPVQLSPVQLGSLVQKAKERFSLNGEITLEANPGEVDENMLRQLVHAGFNRISFGMQSADPQELKVLGRRHSGEQVKLAVAAAQRAGFSNISVDLMLGVPYQTPEHLLQTLELVGQLGIQHVSAYLLKVEPNTPYHHPVIARLLPDEDTVCDLYLLACKKLEELGFVQYEISNFAKPGYESRHNLKYWRAQPYLAFGPSAHGFWNGERYYYPKSLEDYLRSKGTNRKIEEEQVDPLEESILLGLRLSEGICPEELFARYSLNPDRFWLKAKLFEKQGWLKTKDEHLCLTPEGFLVSNYIIAELEATLE